MRFPGRSLSALALAAAAAGLAVAVPASDGAAQGPADAGIGTAAVQAARIPQAADTAAAAQDGTGGRVAGKGTHGHAPRPEPALSRVLRLEAHLLVGEEVDLGTPGRSVGDQFVFSGDLRLIGGPTDRAVGRWGGYCVITDLARNAGQCSSTAVLPDGQITVQGEQTAIPTPAPVSNAVTGGTGAHCTARGQMSQRLVTASVWELTFHLKDGPACPVDQGGTPGGK